MKSLTSSEFRLLYARQTVPIEVTAYGKVVGTWYPYGTDERDFPVTEASTGSLAPETTARFTIRPMHGPRKEMVGVPKRVLDPLDMRKQEQERSDEFQPRQFTPRGRP